jgi:hypothetical protein
MPMMELGEWLPDQNPIALPGLSQADNVYPTLTGYRSFNGRSAVPGVSAIPFRARGAMSGDTQKGTKFTIVGSCEDSGVGRGVDILWSSGEWIEIKPAGSQLDGMDNTSRMQFSTYGDRITMVGRGIVPCSVNTKLSDPNASTNVMQTLSADASKADVSASFKEFLILGNIEGQGTNASAIGTLRAGIHWSTIGDPTDWPQVGTAAAINKQSDFQALDGDGGDITAIVPAGEWCAVFRERQVWRMDYVGGSSFFSFRKIDSNRGCNIPNAAVAVGGVVYFPSSEGFLACNGSTLSPVGESKVDRYWREGTSSASKHLSTAVYNAETESIYWTMAQGGNTPTTVLAYRPNVGKWFQLTGLTCDAILDSVSSVIGGNLDAAPYATYKMDNAGADPTILQDANLDSLGVRSGDRSLAAIDSSGVLHIYNDTEDTLTAELTTGDFEMPGGQRAMLRWIRPIFAGGGTFSGAASGGLNANEEQPMQPLTWMDSTRVLSSQSSEEGQVRRVGGRYIRAQFVSNSAMTKFTGFDFEVRSPSAPSRTTR